MTCQAASCASRSASSWNLRGSKKEPFTPHEGLDGTAADARAATFLVAASRRAHFDADSTSMIACANVALYSSTARLLPLFFTIVRGRSNTAIRTTTGRYEVSREISDDRLDVFVFDDRDGNEARILQTRREEMHAPLSTIDERDVDVPEVVLRELTRQALEANDGRRTWWTNPRDERVKSSLASRAASSHGGEAPASASSSTSSHDRQQSRDGEPLCGHSPLRQLDGWDRLVNDVGWESPGSVRARPRPRPFLHDAFDRSIPHRIPRDSSARSRALRRDDFKFERGTCSLHVHKVDEGRLQRRMAARELCPKRSRIICCRRSDRSAGRCGSPRESPPSARSPPWSSSPGSPRRPRPPPSA